MSAAYVMYTSGSTGAPKGVCVPHRAIVRLVVDTDFVRLNPDEVILQMAPLTFDASTFEIWGALLNGARLVLMTGSAPSTAELASTLARYRVTTLWLPAGLFSCIVEHDPNALAGVRQLVTGGDVVDPQAVRRALAAVPGLTVINGYGPTEATTFSCAYTMTAETLIGDSIPIGRPIANTTAYVRDGDLSPVPAGEIGELCIGGDGLTLGYLHQPELTAASFVPDPFASERGTRLYRTGDRARVLEDGTIEFLGRADRQVKVRGFRVELGEIDATLARHPKVAEVVSVAQPSSWGDKQIVTYVRTGAEARAASTDTGAALSRVVEQWRQVYDEVIYEGLTDGTLEHDDPTFNTQGWNNSYTGLAIPRVELREQVDQTVARILEHEPRSILEIGSGTGMLLFRLIPHCRRYVGTDFSSVAHDYVRRHLEDQKIPCEVSLVQSDAHDLSRVAGERFDVAVLNSVVQHFPSADYLRTLLADVSALVNDGGRIFVGDLRSKALLALFHLSVEWSRADGSLPMRRFCRLVEQKVADERELTVDPQFFMMAALERVGGMRVQLKRGVHHNELTRFRYDVVFDIGRPIGAVAPTISWRWGEDVRSLRELSRLLDEGRAVCVVVRNIANRRCALERWLSERGADHWASETLAELRDNVPDDIAAGSIDPEEVWELGAKLGYRVELGWSPDATDASYDAAFVRAGGRVPPVLYAPQDDPAWRTHANDPLSTIRRAELVRELREYVQSRLPRYMAPAFFVVTDSFPRTQAGKIDVASLQPPEQLARHRGSALRGTDPTQAALSAIWEQLLGIEAVEENENFFDLGGNSLAAIQLVARINEVFGTRISPVAVFERPTLAGLAELLETPGTSSSGWDAKAEASARRGVRRRSRAGGEASCSRRDGQSP